MSSIHPEAEGTQRCQKFPYRPSQLQAIINKKKTKNYGSWYPQMPGPTQTFHLVFLATPHLVSEYVKAQRG